MDNIQIVLQNYLKQANPQPNLVVMDTNLPGNEMNELGFEKKGEYWTISRKDASAALDKILNIPPQFDWGNHWDIEEKTRRDEIPQPG